MVIRLVNPTARNSYDNAQLDQMQNLIEAMTKNHTGKWHGLLPSEVDEALGGRVDMLYGLNEWTTVPTYNTDGTIDKVEELDGEIVMKRTTFSYNDDGSVNTVTDESEGQTVISTFHYTDGDLTSITKELA